MDEKSFENTMMVIIIISGLFVISAFCYCFYYGPVCGESAKVISIGGCDRWGNCGVMTDIGQKAIAQKPAIGETICLYHEIRKIK